MSNRHGIFVPEIIASLPKADIPIDGLHSYLVQGEDQQVIFMFFDNSVSVPEHSHEAQWGVVLDGEMEIVIDGKRKVVRKGDTYFIPKGVVHSAKIKVGYKDITLFNQKDRYSVLSEDHT